MNEGKLSFSVTLNLSAEQKEWLTTLAAEEERPAGKLARRLLIPALEAAWKAREKRLGTTKGDRTPSRGAPLPVKRRPGGGTGSRAS